MKKLHNPSQQKYQKKCLKTLFFVHFTMQYIQGIYRNQLQMASLEDKTNTDEINIHFWEQPLH